MPSEEFLVSDAGFLPTAALRYPLTKKSLRAAFDALKPENIGLTKTGHNQDATVDGSWRLSIIVQHLKFLGFQQTGPKNSLAFVNAGATVGIVLAGTVPHKTANTWSRYSIEVQARSKALTARCPGYFAAPFGL